MSLFACRIHPTVFPAHDAMQAHAKRFFDLDVRLRRIAEEVLPKLRDGFLSRIDSTVGSWSGVFEDTIVAHQGHHSCNIMTIECLIELEDNAKRVFYL